MGDIECIYKLLHVYVLVGALCRSMCLVFPLGYVSMWKNGIFVWAISLPAYPNYGGEMQTTELEEREVEMGKISPSILV